MLSQQQFDLDGDDLSSVTGVSDRGGSTEREIHTLYARFLKLLFLAEEEATAGNFLSAAALAHIAARIAYPGSVGLFGSLRLERLLLQIGKTIPTLPARGPECKKGTSKNILHVLSYGLPIGGDGRCAWRWMQRDSGNRHSVVITSQADLESAPVPDVLRRSAEDSGGFLTVLKGPTSRPLDLAQQLRTLCQGIDIVVLHLYPYDIVPILALAAGCESIDVLFVNHSDHTFWIGASVANSVVHLRTQSTDFLTKRRGLDKDSSILPIPLLPPRASITREEAKLALGYSSQDVLLLTIASPFKYSSPRQLSFLDVVVPIIEKHPHASLIAVGPDPSDPRWQAAHVKTGGRIIARGIRWNNDLLYAAADIYLDSIPFSSITSLLEAASHGTPLLGYDFVGSELSLMGPSAPGLDNAMILASQVESYQRSLSRLVTDINWRHECGIRVRDQVASEHIGNRWLNALREAYSTAERSSRGCLLGQEQTFQVSELSVALFLLYPPNNIRQLIRHHFAALSYDARRDLTLRLYREGFELSVISLMPPPVHFLVRRAGSSIKRILGKVSH